MKIRQWEIWKARPPGFESDHWLLCPAISVTGERHYRNLKGRKTTCENIEQTPRPISKCARTLAALEICKLPTHGF
jgi:hypothetical protein